MEKPSNGKIAGKKRKIPKLKLPEGKVRGTGSPRKEMPNLDLLLREAVKKLVLVEEEGKKKRLTAAELMVRSLVNRAAAGDMKSIALIYREKSLFPTLFMQEKHNFRKASSEEAALAYMKLVREC